MKSRIATLMVHTSPLEQAGVGDAGGMNVYVIENSIKMASAGVEIDIFTRTEKSGLTEAVKISEGVTLHHLEAGPLGSLTKEELPSQIGALTSAFMEHQSGKPDDYYDIIHSHYWISGQLGWMISERTGVPLIHTMHTMAKVKNRALAEGERPEPLIRALGEEQVVANAKALIANTDAEAASLVSLYGADSDLVKVVTPGVDLQRFTPGHGKSGARKILEIAQDALVLTFVGRVQPHKGPEVLVRAVAEMVAHAPHLRAKLALVIIGGASGAGSNEPERLAKVAKFLGVAEIIHFKEPVSRDELADWYRASDLVCVPSYSESFGLVALEAQACGTPVVASAVGGLRTAVSDGISGTLVDGHDQRAWASVLARLLAEPQRRVLLSMGALSHAKRFGWENTARQTLDVYDWVLSKPKSNSLWVAK
ncbi:MAG: D-inositol-3-phosphate glycosyltransferase [Actinomycetota bacterium]